MSRVTELLDYLRGQGPGPDEPDEMDAVQPVDPWSDILADTPYGRSVRAALDEGIAQIERGETVLLEDIEVAPVTIRRGRTYDEPVEGM